MITMDNWHLFNGLLVKLPWEDRQWTVDERERWVGAFEAVLDLMIDVTPDEQD